MMSNTGQYVVSHLILNYIKCEMEAEAFHRMRIRET